MTSATIDPQAIGKSRVALQYSQSKKFLAYIAALLAAPTELEGVLQKVALQTDIDQAEGVNLDVIGEIVGIGRIVPNSIPMQFFGYQDQPGAMIFGEEGIPQIGGRFRDESETGFATSVLADPDYRLLIKAKIVKNHSKGTNEDILKGLSYLFGSGTGAPKITIGDVGGMAIQISIGRQLTFLEKVLIKNLDVLPKPAGVRFSQRVSYDANNYFGFSDQVGARTFNEESVISAVGQFAEEF